VTLLIVGLMTHYFIEGVVSVLLHLTDETQVRVYSGWNDGNFSNVTWAQMKILAPIVSIGRVLMPASILIGAMLGLAADLVTHLDWGFHVFHLNTVNALIGAPVVLWVILRRKNSRSLEL